VFGKKDKLNSN